MTVYGFFPDFSKYKRIISLITLLTFLLAIWLIIDKQLTQSFIPLYGNLGVSIGTLIIISRLVNYPSPIISKIFSFTPLVKIGVISYGLYLWHAPIGAIIEQAGFALDPSLLIAVKILLTFFTAALSYWLVEKPFLRLKNRFNAYLSAKCK
jgi:peptidoglycan/LPS O-acetylase OafA/YrhL